MIAPAPGGKPLGKPVYVLPLDPRQRHEALFLPGAHRRMGTHVVAGKGSGKSRLLGRLIAFSDLFCRVPQVVFDPLGTTIDHLLDKVLRLPDDLQAALWPRIRYIDMSGQRGRVVPLPLYYRLGQESVTDVASRFIEVIARLNPQLASASIEGLPAVREIGTHLGVVLTSLGYQITDGADLLRHPEAWAERLASLQSQGRAERAAAEFFTGAYVSATPAARLHLTRSFRRWLQPFDQDDTMAAMFGADAPAFTLPEIVEAGQTVLLDFRYERQRERRRFKTMWAFDLIYEYIRQRGPEYPTPLAVVVDELTELTSQRSLDADIFGLDLDDLLNKYARNFNCWLTLAHQERAQMTEAMNTALDGMGTQVIGVTNDREAADYLANRYFRFDPYREKYREAVYGSVSDPLAGSVTAQIDWRIHYMPLEEQAELNAQYFMELRPFHFLVRPCTAEGDVSGRVVEADISSFDAGQWPSDNAADIEEARQTLFALEGMPTDDALALVEARRDATSLPPEKAAAAPDILQVDDEDEHLTPDYWNTADEEGDDGAATTGPGR